MAWSAARYARFLGDRTRPARDLLAAVPLDDPQFVVDVGCGPGNSTVLLTKRFPDAQVLGIDSDADMIGAARDALPDVRFELTDVMDWIPERPPDLIYANASLQWLPDHEALFPKLVGMLGPGGVLAVQMPDNLQEPSHIAMRHVAADPAWAARLHDAAGQRQPLIPAASLHALLRPLCSRVDVWRTVYNFDLAGLDAIVEWFRGSALRPYLGPLDDAERHRFLTDYRDEISRSYPETDGRVLLPFPRYFFVAVAR